MRRAGWWWRGPCGSAHHWARRLQALGLEVLGLEVRLIAAGFACAYRMQGAGGKTVLDRGTSTHRSSRCLGRQALPRKTCS
jgi:hypothetical protein